MSEVPECYYCKEAGKTGTLETQRKTKEDFLSTLSIRESGGIAILRNVPEPPYYH